MLKKMLKYDMRSIWRVWWILAVAVLALSVLGMFSLKFIVNFTMLQSTEEAEVFYVLLMLFSILMLIACVFGLVGSTIVTMILVYLRYYRHFFTDEGYLTFTLPVSRKTLLLSKSLNAMIWTALHILLLFVGICILSMGFPSEYYDGNNFYGLFAVIGDAFREGWKAFGGWLILYLAEGVLALVSLLAFTVALVQFCITIASVIAKKAKILVAIAVYYGANTVVSTVTQMFAMILALTFGSGASIGLLDGASATVVHLVCALVILLITVMVSAVTSILYFNTLGCLERKLNLA